MQTPTDCRECEALRLPYDCAECPLDKPKPPPRSRPTPDAPECDACEYLDVDDGQRRCRRVRCVEWEDREYEACCD